MADLMSYAPVARGGTGKATPRKKAKVIHMKTSYPRSEAAVRHYWLWSAPLKKGQAGEYVRYRYFSNLRNAHNAALIEMKWSKKDIVLHVINVTYGRFLGEYKRVMDAHGNVSIECVSPRNVD